MENTGCCCSIESKNKSVKGILDRPWISCIRDVNGAGIPIVRTELSDEDRKSNRKVRWSSMRMVYTIPPGLYSVGNSDSSSPVLVTSNYKLTFDKVREQLECIDAWLLVLDTKGINVWCAAGKGTFGTDELVNRVEEAGLSDIVEHGKLILPQLGAPGVSASEVKKRTGFSVVYGPVRAEDIPVYLAGNGTKTEEMKRVRFPVTERFILTPMEFIPGLKIFYWFIPFLILLNLLEGDGILLKSVKDIVMVFAALVTGSVLTPVLMPWIPGRSLALKGWITGGLLTVLYFLIFSGSMSEILFYSAVLPPLSSFLALNFTGSTTYTSLSGVLKEMKYGLPVMLLSLLAGLAVKIHSIVV